MSEKILLAYSGGLDTSIIIPWLLENYDCEVLAMAGEVGIGIDRDFLIQKALKCGASACFVEDISEEFITDFIYPTLKAGAIYEGKNRWLRRHLEQQPVLLAASHYSSSCSDAFGL